MENGKIKTVKVEEVLEKSEKSRERLLEKIREKGE
jgi:hypothetical protein